jgi:DNA-binding winged helix-turn-helix (wHTH) protein/TolB-like protein
MAREDPLSRGRVRFGPFDVDLASGELRQAGIAVPIQDLPFRLLAALLERPGEVVSRAALRERIWGTDTFVDATAGLNTAVAKLREALADDPENPRYIETIPKRGYRFVGRIDASDITNAQPATQADPGVPAGRPARTPGLLWLAGGLAIAAVLAGAVYLRHAKDAPVRVAVVLFDNETGRPNAAPLAQGLTDAAVTELTADSRLAVIGNAAVLRTERPFRDIAKVRDTLDADYIVIGQVQSRDAETIVRAHLIRAADQAHVWVDVATLTTAGEAALQADVARRIRSALDARLRATR